MGSKCNPRDCYDLCYRRHRIKCRVGVEESQDKMEARKKENERTSSLNEISETLREVLKKNDALASAINLGTHLLQGADSKSLPALQERPLTPRPSRPDTDVEDAVIRARLDSASHLAKVLVDSLEQINKAILQPNINSPRPSQKPTSQEPTVFYRVCDRKSYTSHDFGLAFWSARGLPDHDFGDPVEQEFRAHVAGEHTLPKPFAERGRFKSPYISLTTDPGFACKFGTKYDGQFVFEIDAVKLRRMGVHVESTVDIADRWRVPYRGSEPRLHYIFPSHWLARFWIPRECMKPHSFTQFRDKCRKSGFFNGKTGEPVPVIDLPADAHEKLASLLKDLGVPQEFADEGDDEPTTSVSPSSPKPADANDDKVGENPPLVQTPASPTPTPDPELVLDFEALSMGPTPPN